MTTVSILAAIFLPWFAGIAIAIALTDSTTTRSLRIGAGWLIGQALVITGLYQSLRWTGSGHARIILLMLTLIAVVAVWGSSRIKHPQTHEKNKCRFGPLGKVVLIVIGLSLAIKLLLLIAAHAAIPIRCDDAISLWLFKAKVVATLDRLPLNPTDPYFQAGSNPHYPIFPSLAAAWTPMIAGGWDERIATLPWLFYYLNLLLLIAGGLQRWLGLTASWIAAYLVASLPLLVVHVYRPGYADLILACFLAAATIFFLTWLSTARLQDFLLSIVFACMVAIVKREGPPLAAWCLIVFLLAGRRQIQAATPRSRALMGSCVLLIVLGVACVLDFTEHSETLFGLGYHRDVWSAMARHLFVWNSFGFFFLLAAAAWVLAIVRGRGPLREVAALLPLGWIAYIFAIFLLTPQARFALNDQTPSRLLLQIVPATALILAIAISDLIRNPKSEIRNEAPHAAL